MIYYTLEYHFFKGEPIRDIKTGLCVQCKPGEEGEIIGLVRPDDRGGPEKFQVQFYIDCKPRFCQLFSQQYFVDITGVFR